MAKYKKRVTLHPLKEDGTMDLDTNLYPKTFLDGIVDRDGNEVDVALKEEIPTDFVTHEELDDAISDLSNTYATKEYVDTNKGTKLYKHTLQYLGGNVYLINNSSAVISDRYGAWSAFNNPNCISARYGSAPNYYILINIVPGAENDRLYYIDNTTGAVESLPVEFESDTVTEL